jgi:hypothetical protein
MTHLYDETEPTTVPFITILVARTAVATYAEASAEHGVILDNIWDESALAGFDCSLVLSDVNCPILAAQEGYSRAVNITSRTESLLLHAQPLLIPEGQKPGLEVSLDEITHFWAFSSSKYATYYWACAGHLLSLSLTL